MKKNDRSFLEFYQQAQDIINIIAEFLPDSSHIENFAEFIKKESGAPITKVLGQIIQNKKKQEEIVNVVTNKIQFTASNYNHEQHDEIIKTLAQAVNYCCDNQLIYRLEKKLLMLNLQPIHASVFYYKSANEPKQEKFRYIPYNVKSSFLWCKNSLNCSVLMTNNKYIYCDNNPDLSLIFAPYALTINCSNNENMLIIINNDKKNLTIRLTNQNNIMKFSVVEFRSMLLAIKNEEIQADNNKLKYIEQIKKLGDCNLELLAGQALSVIILEKLEKSKNIKNPHKITPDEELLMFIRELKSEYDDQYEILELQIKNSKILKGILEENGKAITLDDLVNEWERRENNMIEQPLSVSKMNIDLAKFK